MLDAGNALRVVISGGGTGGHVFPAISIAQEWMQWRPNTRLHFVGAVGKLEMSQVPAAGFQITGLWIRGLQRKEWWKNFLLPLQFLVSLGQALAVLRQHRPHLVVGVGGYASGPLLLMAQACGFPTVLQEQNAYPGATNRWLGRRASRIYVAFEGMEKYFDPGKILNTGNPIRRELLGTLPDKAAACAFFGLATDHKVLLVLGGSLGARAINLAVESWLEREDHSMLCLWQCGRNYQAPTELVQRLGSRLVVLPFIREMNMAYACADLILSRAGAGTMSELAVVGKPCILVPSPYVAANHQYHNARNWSDRAAAWSSSDECIREDLPGLVQRWLQHPEQGQEMAQNLSKLAQHSAGIAMVRDMFQCIQQAKTV